MDGRMCPSTHLEYYSATKRREALTLTITWTDPENTMLSEKQTQKDTQGVIPLMGNIRNWQIHRHKEWAPGCQGMGGRGFQAERTASIKVLRWKHAGCSKDQ